MRIDKPIGTSHIQVRANVKLELLQDGKIIHEESGHNLVVTDGLGLLAELMDPNGSTAPPEYAALGSGNVPADVDDTGLGAEHSGSRTAEDATVATQTYVGIIAYSFTITATDTWEVNEVGLFNDAVSGTMFARFLTQGFTMVSGNVLRLMWHFAFGHAEDLE